MKTPAEAANCVCPVRRGAQYIYNEGRQIASDDAFCIGGTCMWWRWQEVGSDEEPTKGYCGHVLPPLQRGPK